MVFMKAVDGIACHGKCPVARMPLGEHVDHRKSLSGKLVGVVPHYPGCDAIMLYYQFVDLQRFFSLCQ
jgi:hypothetical protein